MGFALKDRGCGKRMCKEVELGRGDGGDVDSVDVQFGGAGI